MVNINQHPFENQKIITADLYKGSIIEKAYGGGDEGLISAEIIRVQLNNKLEKGIIDKPLYDKAIEQLESLVKGGEGSRGGHIIGHTKSGKPVYDTKHAGREHYKEFTPEEHEDAAMIHRKRSEEHGEKASKGYSAYAKAHHGGMREWHDDTAKSHEHHADKKRKATASPDEKKIIADQKKKQIDHHKEGEDFHGSLLNDFYKNHGTDENKWSSHMKEAHSQWKDKMFHHKSEKERLEKE